MTIHFVDTHELRIPQSVGVPESELRIGCWVSQISISDVVFIRCPSSHFYQDIEREYLPRARIYDRLIAKTQTLSLHFEDYESMQGLDIPEHGTSAYPTAE